ncbi:hypothetical protein SDC9_191812 [bioreactor metagenome]|uniref:Uncharacterized protein n=1 Tax=bioreactor metagenome TaxID=1076179 RepID=A0A645HZA7_9ZZZZ|nr:hypothetical protein [Propionivibrio sp.]
MKDSANWRAGTEWMLRQAKWRALREIRTVMVQKITYVERFPSEYVAIRQHCAKKGTTYVHLEQWCPFMRQNRGSENFVSIFLWGM